MHNKRRRLLATLFAAIVAMVALVGGATSAYAEPTVSKSLESNNDGTYKLSLSVTGDASSSSSSTKANVVIVFDTSESMKDKTFKYEEGDAGWRGTTYGLVDNTYKALTYHQGTGLTSEYWSYRDDDGNTQTYTGTRYHRVTVDKTRLQVAKEATNSLITSLLQNNTTENPDAVEISLVEFDSIVNDTSNWSTSSDYLAGKVNNYSADHRGQYRGGTNWEVALAKAKQLADAKSADGDATYVVFVSDGNPTFRATRNPRKGAVVNPDSKTVYGTGSSDNNGYNLLAAQYVARSIRDAGYSMYSVGAFGDADKMQDLITENGNRFGAYYDASDETTLNQAFADIIKNITSGLSYKDVVVTDNMTALTSVLPAGTTAKNFEYSYTKDGAAYDPAQKPETPGAKLDGKKVTWDFGGMTLEKGVTYTVSFDVWPSQQAYDLLADLNNGNKSYESLSPDEKDMVVKNGDNYTLRTNTASGNELTYTKVETTTQNGQTTIDETKDQKVEIKDRPELGLASQQVSVKKEWDNDLDPDKRGGVDPAKLKLTSDGDSPASVEKELLPSDYAASVSIAPGIIVDGKVYEPGHDYTLSETSDPGYWWEFSAPTYHPMIIDGTLTTLVKADDGDIPISGFVGKYKALKAEDGTTTTTITGTNNRRSDVNLIKKVVPSDPDAPADAEFTFKLTVTDAKDADVWYSVDNGESKSFKSGATVEVTLKADQNLRIFNLPTGSSYTFEETKMPAGFSFVETSKTVKDVEGETKGTSQTYTGVVDVPNTSTTVTYTNKYKAITVDTNASAFLTKAVNASDEAWKAANGKKTFEFSIDGVGGAPLAKDAEGKDITTGTATFTGNGRRTIDFGTITYTKAGTYTYTVKETSELTDGWKCDKAEQTVTVKVEDVDAKLVATVEGATITNTYSTTPAELNSATKAVFTKKAESTLKLTKDATFSFTIAPVGNAPAPTKPEASVTFTATGEQNVDFGTFTFEKAGDYEYTVTEGDLPAGWTASSKTATIKIHVADGGHGKLVATVEQVGEITNIYGVKPADDDPPVKKVIKGDIAAENMPTFEFTLKADDAANPMPAEAAVGAKTVSIKGAGPTEFGKISFTAPGTYTYTITETKGGGSGWTNDTQTYTLKYEVKDKGDGTLSVTRTINDDAKGEAVFTNEYKTTGKLDTSADAGIVLKKTVQNSIHDAEAKWTPKTFEFTIAPAEGNPAKVAIDKTTGTATFDKAGTQTISFGNITFTKAGTYNFTLTETTQSAGGWTCDNTPKNVEVKVEDDGAGNLTAKVTKAAEITNTYGDEPLQGDTAVKLSVNKTLSGTNLAAGQFSFTLTPKTDGDTNAAQTKSNAADGTVSFDGLEYTKPGVYKYPISEVNDGKAGYTYDGTSAKVTVTVTDNGDGTMKAEVAYTKQTFSNSYEAKGNTDGTIYAQKNLAGRQLEEGQFSFQLKDSDGNVRQTKTNDASGRVIFDSITYDQSIFGNEPATDSTTDKDDATEDNKSEDKSDDAAQDETKPESNATDEENKSTDSEATNGAAEPAADSADESAAQTEANTEESAEAEANPASTLVDALTSLVATPANAETTKRTKTFTYTISEVNDGKAGYEYDGHVETVKVTVTDEGNGKLSVVTTYDEDGAVFNNSYTASGETGDSIKATKKLTGRDGMTEGEFQFALLDKAGNTVATGKNAADGSVTFSSIKYSQNDASPKGTVHEYTMVEVVENDKAEKGMTYDTAKLPVKVTVTDKGDGHLATAVDYPEGNTFTNTYKPLTGNGYLTARKVLEGRDLKAGEFSFQLLDADGKVVATRTNDADGIVTFDGLSFDEAREYTFEVQEVKGDDETITYDDKVAKYTVKVEDKGGQLNVTSVTADGSDQAPVFTNVYTAKESPKTPAAPASPAAPAKSSGATKSSGAVAKTGDTTTSVVGIVIAGAAIVAGGLYLRKRNTAAKK